MGKIQEVGSRTMVISEKRFKAYIAINTERYYQNNFSEDRTCGVKHSVGDYTTMLQYYQTKLVEAWTNNPGDTQALEIMRKIAGIAVHCMEDHGSIQRQLPASLPEWTEENHYVSTETK